VWINGHVSSFRNSGTEARFVWLRTSRHVLDIWHRILLSNVEMLTESFEVNNRRSKATGCLQRVLEAIRSQLSSNGLFEGLPDIELMIGRFGLRLAAVEILLPGLESSVGRLKFNVDQLAWLLQLDYWTSIEARWSPLKLNWLLWRLGGSIELHWTSKVDLNSEVE